MMLHVHKDRADAVKHLSLGDVTYNSNLISQKGGTLILKLKQAEKLEKDIAVKIVACRAVPYCAMLCHGTL